MMAGVPSYAVYLSHSYFDPSMTGQNAAALAEFLMRETASQDPKVGGPIHIQLRSDDNAADPAWHRRRCRSRSGTCHGQRQRGGERNGRGAHRTSLSGVRPASWRWFPTGGSCSVRECSACPRTFAGSGSDALRCSCERYDHSCGAASIRMAPCRTIRTDRSGSRTRNARSLRVAGGCLDRPWHRL